jgi:Mrp family chromosome partitioning ATPase
MAKLDEKRIKVLTETSEKGMQARELMANGYLVEFLDEVKSAYNTLIVEMGPDETDNFSHIASKKDALRDIIVTLTALDKTGEKADLELSGKKRKKRGLL